MDSPDNIYTAAAQGNGHVDAGQGSLGNPLIHPAVAPPAATRIERIWQLLQQPWLGAGLNLLLVVGACLANWFWQVYCQPVLWAALLLVIAFLPVVLWPVIGRYWPRSRAPLQVVRGIAFSICVYCIVFLESGTLVSLLMVPVGIGILGLAPHIFALQLLVNLFAKSADWLQRGMFLAGIGVSLMTANYLMWDFKQAVPIAQSLAAQPMPYDGPHAAAVERILGMHFKYHTRELIGIDGWRPPLHDPAMVIGLWSLGRQDPLPLRLDERIALYRQVFPSRNPQADCVCALGDGEGYRGSAWFSQ